MTGEGGGEPGLETEGLPSPVACLTRLLAAAGMRVSFLAANIGFLTHSAAGPWSASLSQAGFMAALKATDTPWPFP